MNNKGYEMQERKSNYPALARLIKTRIDWFPKNYYHPASVRLTISKDDIEELKEKGFAVRILCESYLEGMYECEVSWLNPTAREAELIRDYAIAKSLDG